MASEPSTSAAKVKALRLEVGSWKRKYDEAQLDNQRVIDDNENKIQQLNQFSQQFRVFLGLRDEMKKQIERRNSSTRPTNAYDAIDDSVTQVIGMIPIDAFGYHDNLKDFLRTFTALLSLENDYIKTLSRRIEADEGLRLSYNDLITKNASADVVAQYEKEMRDNAEEIERMNAQHSNTVASLKKRLADLSAKHESAVQDAARTIEILNNTKSLLETELQHTNVIKTALETQLKEAKSDAKKHLDADAKIVALQTQIDAYALELQDTVKELTRSKEESAKEIAALETSLNEIRDTLCRELNIACPAGGSNRPIRTSEDVHQFTEQIIEAIRAASETIDINPSVFHKIIEGFAAFRLAMREQLVPLNGTNERFDDTDLKRVIVSTILDIFVDNMIDEMKWIRDMSRNDSIADSVIDRGFKTFLTINENMQKLRTALVDPFTEAYENQVAISDSVKRVRNFVDWNTTIDPPALVAQQDPSATSPSTDALREFEDDDNFRESINTALDAQPMMDENDDSDAILEDILKQSETSTHPVPATGSTAAPMTEPVFSPSANATVTVEYDRGSVGRPERSRVSGKRKSSRHNVYSAAEKRRMVPLMLDSITFYDDDGDDLMVGGGIASGESNRVAAATTTSEVTTIGDNIVAEGSQLSPVLSRIEPLVKRTATQQPAANDDSEDDDSAEDRFMIKKKTPITEEVLKKNDIHNTWITLSKSAAKNGFNPLETRLMSANITEFANINDDMNWTNNERLTLMLVSMFLMRIMSDFNLSPETKKSFIQHRKGISTLLQNRKRRLRDAQNSAGVSTSDKEFIKKFYKQDNDKISKQDKNRIGPSIADLYVFTKESQRQEYIKNARIIFPKEKDP